ncbi:MAG: M20/M25/M40 family metallo-hydrolase [Desulfovibrio sp.]|nr:M20/M25/M40 family metallo-hydrolase [Desulfovibrio sp.]
MTTTSAMANEYPEATLASRLVRLGTTDEGNEEEALRLPAEILEEAGFECSFDAYDPDRPDRRSLIARLNKSDDRPSLYFGGHIDTVPYGDGAWEQYPLSGAVRDGLLYGRGSCDMKGGVAALVCACAGMAPKLGKRDLILHIYGGEERGCLGSLHATKRPEVFGNAGAGIIAEPTDLVAQVGHKGALWLEVETHGRAAHASMPEKGDNALLRLLSVADKLRGFRPDASHPWLGSGTFALTTLHAGKNCNSIPDKAMLTVDMRTVPGQDHAALFEYFQKLAGDGAQVRKTYDGLPVWTDPSSTWCARARARAGSISGRSTDISCARFFTDAASVKRLLPDLPLLILGPGQPENAHVRDETCPVEQIVTARRIYEALIEDWYFPEDR